MATACSKTRRAKGNPNEIVVPSPQDAWDAYFQKEAIKDSVESLWESGWVSIYSFMDRVGLARTAAERKAVRDSLLVKVFSVPWHGKIRRVLFVKLPQLKG